MLPLLPSQPNSFKVSLPALLTSSFPGCSSVLCNLTSHHRVIYQSISKQRLPVIHLSNSVGTLCTYITCFLFCIWHCWSSLFLDIFFLWFPSYHSVSSPCSFWIIIIYYSSLRNFLSDAPKDAMLTLLWPFYTLYIQGFQCHLYVVDCRTLLEFETTIASCP